MAGPDARAAEAAEPIKIAEGREAEIFGLGEREVLRLYRDPGAGPRADRELLALECVRAALPRVPAAYGRMDRDGRPGLRMQRLDGRGMLAEVQRRPWRAFALAGLCGRLHAEVNRVRAPDTLPALRSELGRRIESASAIPSDLRAAALDELARLPDGDALCHGDFQPDNVLMCRAGPVVIDWSDATRGDPCGDFARTALMMKVGSLPPGAPPLIVWLQGMGRGLFARAYVAGYEKTTRYDAALGRRWMLVRAVERMAYGIAEEHGALLRAAERLRASATSAS